ncbi:MAG: SPFH domain-containing protein [Bryobacteraceae bacterium]|nr:SPFH domain-containing protein [Bryobacteraceae bacterium]
MIGNRFYQNLENIIMIRETQSSTPSGFAMLAVSFVVIVAAILGIIRVAKTPEAWLIIPLMLLILTAILVMTGLFTVEPNQGVVLTLFGTYKGTEKNPGLRWANPFLGKRKISLRVRNFETQKLKVNDLDGNPIEIAAVVVWQVIDTAEACFEVDNYENYVHVQSESALRNLATSYAYDSHDDHGSLRGSSGEIALHLQREIQDRLLKAGVQALEARISHLAYAQEIAAAMLQRQQASAIIAARQKIVEGAVGMVEMALDMLSKRSVVQLDEERKAAMVSNLLVVLCGERGTQPVVNTGTLYN